MVKLVKYKQSFFQELDYALSPDQARFTSDISSCLVHSHDQSLIIVILYEEEAAGFFVLDNGPSTSGLTDNAHAVLFRSFSIHPLLQGRGIAKQALRALAREVGNFFPGTNEIVLSVNTKNTSAYRLYIATGFEDSGRLIDGVIGHQHVLSKKI